MRRESFGGVEEPGLDRIRIFAELKDWEWRQVFSKVTPQSFQPFRQLVPALGCIAFHHAIIYSEVGSFGK